MMAVYSLCVLLPTDLNLLDWSVNGHMAVCLGGQVYVWNSANGEIQQLMEMEGPEDYVSSVSWISEGNYLAIGTSTSDVQVGNCFSRSQV